MPTLAIDYNGTYKEFRIKNNWDIFNLLKRAYELKINAWVDRRIFSGVITREYYTAEGILEYETIHDIQLNEVVQ